MFLSEVACMATVVRRLILTSPEKTRAETEKIKSPQWPALVKRVREGISMVNVETDERIPVAL